MPQMFVVWIVLMFLSCTIQQSSLNITTLPFDNPVSGEDEQQGDDECRKCLHDHPTIEQLHHNTTSNKTLILSWSALDETYDNCKFTYWINQTWHKFPYFAYRRTQENFIEFENVQSCTKYNVTVGLENGCNLNATTFNTTIFTAPDYVRNINVDANLGVIDWANNAISEECNNFTLYINNVTFSIANERTFAYNRSLYCTKIGLQAIRSDGTAGDTYTQKVEPGPVQHLNLTIDNYGSVIVSWRRPKEDECVDKYVIRGDSGTLGEVPDDYFSFSADNLAYNQRHNIKVAAKSSYNGLIGEFVTESIYLPQPVPSEVVNFSADDYMDNNSVILHWKPPQIIPGKLNLYELIYNHHPIHYKPNDCMPQNLQEIITLLPKENDYTINNLEANSKYTFVLRAKADYFGSNSSIYLTTRPREPDAVRDVLYNLEVLNETGSLFKVNLQIKWTYPCNTNDNFSHFIVELLLNDDVASEFKIEPNEPISDVHYVTLIENLMAESLYKLTVYTKTVSDGTGKSMEYTFSTPSGRPSDPIITSITSDRLNTFTVNWSPPKYPNGAIIDYEIIIMTLDSLHFIPPSCESKTGDKAIATTTAHNFTFDSAVPNYRYGITLTAKTRGGRGAETPPHRYKTPRSVADPVRHLTVTMEYNVLPAYAANAMVEFEPPCNANGESIAYRVALRGWKDGAIEDKQEQNGVELEYSFDLLPDYAYVASVVVSNDVGTSEVADVQFLSPAGVPMLNQEYGIDILLVSTTNITVSINRNIFEEGMGTIQHYAIFIVSTLAQYNKIEHAGVYTNSTRNTNIGRQVTENNWNPFIAKSQQAFYIIGGHNDTLIPNTEYTIFVRAFTRNTYADSLPVTTKTLNLSSDWIIIVTGVATMLVAIVLTLLLLYYKKFKQKDEVKALLASLDGTNQPPKAISIDKFPVYYAQLNETMLKNEFVTLGKHNDGLMTTSTASLAENKKKNRYVNILPYDETRVLLQNNNYINASYIKGYSNQIEYIATQGPLELTLNDFWRMVIDENVRVIVMVAHFIEQNKTKCHKYFPNVNETIDLGDEMTIVCNSEETYDYYCERGIEVCLPDGASKIEVIHLQFLNWPDFGCPKGTENMLRFAMMMRQLIDERACERTVIHCSAGVGRTGTLIAIDILLQKIANNCDIDIFNTVLSLRKQRKNMVQAEAQYFYIYDCIADAILNPPKKLKDHIISTTDVEPYQSLNSIELKDINNTENKD